MNIKNKPVIKMDAKEQIKFNLKREVQLLRLQNNFLRQEYMKVTGESYVDMPELPELERLVGKVSDDSGLFPSINNRRNMAEVSHSFDGAHRGGMSKGGKHIGPAMGGVQDKSSAFYMMQRDQNMALKSDDELGQLDHQLGVLRQENAQMRYQKELMNREFEGMMYENNSLISKLANLEKVFIGESMDHDSGNGYDDSSTTAKKYSHGLLVAENNELRARIEHSEQEKIELKGILIQLEADHAPSTGLTRDNSRDLSPGSLKVMEINQTNLNPKNDTPSFYYQGKQPMHDDYNDLQKPSSSASKKSTDSSYMRFKRAMNSQK